MQFHRLQPQRFLARHAWLWLWLALLVPVAQTAAACHAVSHSAAAEKQVDVHAASCDLCLSAAALGGIAPPAAPALALAPGVQHALVDAPVGTALRAAAPLPYRSRAPPALS
jgi:hypothetical protein